MKRFFLACVAMCLALPVLAQYEDPADAAFQKMLVSNVRLRLDEATGASLIFNASPAVCEPLITEISIDGAVIDANIYVPLGSETATCNFIVPYEPVIELGDLAPDVLYTLLLNDFATQFFVSQPEGIIMDMPFPMTWGKDNPLFGFMRVDSFVDTVDYRLSEDDTVLINVTGSHPDGCETNVLTWTHPDAINTTAYHAEIFRLIPEGVMCPASLVAYETAIDTGLAADSSFYLEIDGRWFVYNADGFMPINQQLIQIDEVSIDPNGDSFEVNVLGEMLDCGVDLSRAELSKDYASFIELALYYPMEDSCGASNPYEALFVVDSLPVIINGASYGLDGSLPARAQGLEPDGRGGNLMEVDTVIESVEVLVLESFPMRLNLVVTGYQPDGCQVPVQVTQSVVDNVVTVHVYRELPPDVMCTMMIVPYEETISIEGSFEGGTVEIRVNEFETSVDL